MNVYIILKNFIKILYSISGHYPINWLSMKNLMWWHEFEDPNIW